MAAIRCEKSHWFDIDAGINPTLANQVERDVTAMLYGLQCPACAQDAKDFMEMNHDMEFEYGRENDLLQEPDGVDFSWAASQNGNALNELIAQINAAYVPGLIKIPDNLLVDGKPPEQLEELFG